MENQNNNEEMDKGYSNTWLLVLLSILCIAISASVLFIPQISEITLVYISCGALVGCGVYQIGKFFLTKAYKSLKEYGFALGAMLVILGCCGIANAHALADVIDVLFGLVTLFLGIILLQCTVQLKTIKNGAWAFIGVLAFMLLVGAVLVLGNFQWLTGGVKSFSSWLMLVAGACNLVSFPLVALVLHQNRKKEEKEAEQQYVPSSITVNPIIETEVVDHEEPVHLPNKKVKFIDADHDKETVPETADEEQPAEEATQNEEESVSQPQ